MGADLINKKETKYVLIYGVKGCGKTLLQYNMQTCFKVEKNDIKPTQGYNYEERTLSNVTLGIFDVSGDPHQYEIVDIVLKSVEIRGIIFVVPLENLEELDKSKLLLKQVISNNNLEKDIPILIVFNERKLKENLDWMDFKNLKEILFPEDLQTDSNKSKVFYCKLDISKLLNESNEASREYYEELEKFANELKN